MAADWVIVPDSGEDDGLAAVDEDAVFDVPDDGTGEDGALDLAADPAQVGHVLAVIDAPDVLLDDRAGVEILGYVVGGGTD